ncbi:MAG: putative response regulator [Candidatus Peribacteria bacterium]|nr:putative response regulator [Candidatus Peribacteria bacterium]
MRTILRTMLEKAFPGTEFFEASTGVQAMSLWHEHQPDLLLLDLVMPEKGGIEVLRETGALKAAKVIIISALGQDKIIQEAMSLGALAFIVKPFDEKQVIDTVTKAMGV